MDSASNSELGAVVPVLEAAQELLTFNGNQSVNPVSLRQNQSCLILTFVITGDTTAQILK